MKKFSLLLGSLLLVFGIYMFYLFEFKGYETEDASIDQIAKEEYVIDLEDGSKIILDKHGNLIRHITNEDGTDKIEAFTEDSQFKDLAAASVSSDNKSTQQTKKEPHARNTQKDKPVASWLIKKKTEKMTVAEIREKYDPAISDLEAQAYQNLEDLIDLAVSEYLEMDANNQKISYPYFYNKYTSAASDLEERTDKMFFALMKVMEQDLKAHGQPIDIIRPMIKEYEGKKTKLRHEIFKKTAGL